jgi:hypothetical protein
MSPLSSELEDNFGVSDQAQFIAGESLDGFGVFLEVADFELQLVGGLEQFRIFGTNLIQLSFQRSQSWEPFRRKHEHRGAYGRQRQNRQRKNAFDNKSEPGHPSTLPRNLGKSQVGCGCRTHGGLRAAGGQ